MVLLGKFALASSGLAAPCRPVVQPIVPARSRALPPASVLSRCNQPPKSRLMPVAPTLAAFLSEEYRLPRKSNMRLQICSHPRLDGCKVTSF